MLPEICRCGCNASCVASQGHRRSAEQGFEASTKKRSVLLARKEGLPGSYWSEASEAACKVYSVNSQRVIRDAAERMLPGHSRVSYM